MKTVRVATAALPAVVIGGNGMLGRELVRALNGTGFPVTTLDRPKFNLTNHNEAGHQLKKAAPRYVFNAAAYTDVDGCEANPQIAYAINGEAVGMLARVCAGIGATLVHFSTDYVFDGANPAGYVEDAAPHPLSVYGKSKWEGERLLQQSGCRYRLIRTSWLFGPGRRDNVVEKIVSRAKQDGKLKLVNDRWGKPTFATDLAFMVASMVFGGQDENGIYHLTNATPPSGVTWYEFGKAIVELLGLAVDITPCRSAEFPQPAVRPVYSLLVNTKEKPLRPWRQALVEYLETRNW